jgi:multiple sugar transport system substrate-binding protein
MEMTRMPHRLATRRRVLSSMTSVFLASAMFGAGGVATTAQAASGELVVLNWLAGSEAEMMKNLEAAFAKKYPEITVREIPLTWSGDPRGAIRTTLLGGEKVDVVINTWPSFRKELVDAGLLRPLDDVWASKGWDAKLSESWKTLGSIDGTFYGLSYNYGDRSGLWYRPDTLKKAGIENPPKDWAEFLASFGKLKAAGVTPYVVPAKFWAHAEVFETLLIRTAGVEVSRKLASHDIKWTDEAVKGALRKWREMLEADCCADVSTMLGTDWDNAADIVLKNGTGGYFLLGMWINSRAVADYKITPETDYSLLQFPPLGLGHDNGASVDAKEFVAVTTGENPEAADLFLDFALSAEGANVIAAAGLATPSKAVDTSLYSPIIAKSNDAVTKSDVVFVLGDMLPGDLADEYRVQLQKFLQDPSDQNIDAITEAIEAKAQAVY